ncbi:hypothetical protein ACFX2I_034509 [Malus domestica]
MIPTTTPATEASVCGSSSNRSSALLGGGPTWMKTRVPPRSSTPSIAPPVRYGAPSPQASALTSSKPTSPPLSPPRASAWDFLNHSRFTRNTTLPTLQVRT